MCCVPDPPPPPPPVVRFPAREANATGFPVSSQLAFREPPFASSPPGASLIRSVVMVAKSRMKTSSTEFPSPDTKLDPVRILHSDLTRGMRMDTVKSWGKMFPGEGQRAVKDGPVMEQLDFLDDARKVEAIERLMNDGELDQGPKAQLLRALNNGKSDEFIERFDKGWGHPKCPESCSCKAISRDLVSQILERYATEAARKAAEEAA